MGEHESEVALPAGAEIGPYTVVRPLGAGAFGAVYEARKRPLDKRIALKVLHRDKAQNPTINMRFVQEAQAAASLKHPHIVDVDDIGVLDGVPYLAMEFLDGESLADLLKREGPLTPARTMDVLLPVLSAVAAVHVRGIVHRDLKPDNIFLWKPVAGQLHPKLLDFGIAKVREGEGAGLTKTGAIMGTPMYMSPEQWGGSKNATGASDQWALGVILFQCLTGRLPFEADELPALMMRVSVHPPEPLRSLAPQVPEALEFAVMRALEKDPARRHPSVRDLGKALLPFASAATRSRWSAEFVGEGASLGSMATLEASGQGVLRPTPVPIAPPTIPDTLNASVRSIDQAPVKSRRGRLLALGALGLLGVLGGVALVTRLTSASTEPAHSASTDTVRRSATPATQPAAPTVTALRATVAGPTPTPPAVRAPTLPAAPAAPAADAGVTPHHRRRHDSEPREQRNGRTPVV